MRDAPEYTIRTVADFLTVPPDRREICIAEFAVWLSLVEEARKVLGDLLVSDPGAAFEWVDDDKSEARMTFVADGNVIAEANVSMRAAGDA